MKNAMTTVLVLLVSVWIGQADTLSRGDEQTTGHRSHISARITTENGAQRSITVEGVGCWQSLCSRIAVRGKSDGNSQVTTTWLDSIAAIRDITTDNAGVVLKDGTVRRLAIGHDNRVIYFLDQHGREAKLDLAGVKSIEFPNS